MNKDNKLLLIWEAWNKYIYSNFMVWTFLIFSAIIDLILYITYERIIFLIGWVICFAIMFQRFLNWLIKIKRDENQGEN